MMAFYNVLNILALAIIKALSGASSDAWMVGIAILLGANTIAQALDARFRGR